MNKGTHIIANFHLANAEKLIEYSDIRLLLNTLVVQNELNLIGEIFHNFEPQGFTGILCLSESHISIHTFPETNYCTFDIYLSNFNNDNAAKGELIYQRLKDYFEPISIVLNHLTR